MGDALAVAMLEEKGFTRDDFALSHPGGSLGKRLLLMVHDIMHSGTAIPAVTETAFVCDALLEMTEKKLGMTAIINSTHKVIGVFTDGDLRRMLAKNLNIQSTYITEVMTTHYSAITIDMLAVEAMQIMQQQQINSLLVMDNTGQLVGALNMHDLIRAGIV